MSLYVALYPSYGGRALGYRCELAVHKEEASEGLVFETICGKVCKSERGMKAHLWRKHGIRIQGELFDESAQSDVRDELRQ